MKTNRYCIKRLSLKGRNSTKITTSSPIKRSLFCYLSRTSLGINLKGPPIGSSALQATKIN